MDFIITLVNIKRINSILETQNIQNKNSQHSKVSMSEQAFSVGIEEKTVNDQRGG